MQIIARVLFRTSSVCFRGEHTFTPLVRSMAALHLLQSRNRARKLLPAQDLLPRGIGLVWGEAYRNRWETSCLWTWALITATWLSRSWTLMTPRKRGTVALKSPPPLNSLKVAETRLPRRQCVLTLVALGVVGIVRVQCCRPL